MQITKVSFNMEVIAIAGDAVYLRLPKELQRDAGGCTCDYCTRHPEEPPKWDTLAVPTNAELGSRRAYSWTVHLPDPKAFLAALKRKEKPQNV